MVHSRTSAHDFRLSFSIRHRIPAGEFVQEPGPYLLEVRGARSRAGCAAVVQLAALLANSLAVEQSATCGKRKRV